MSQRTGPRWTKPAKHLGEAAFDSRNGMKPVKESKPLLKEENLPRSPMPEGQDQTPGSCEDDPVGPTEMTGPHSSEIQYLNFPGASPGFQKIPRNGDSIKRTAAPAIGVLLVNRKPRSHHRVSSVDVEPRVPTFAPLLGQCGVFPVVCFNKSQRNDVFEILNCLVRIVSSTNNLLLSRYAPPNNPNTQNVNRPTYVKVKESVPPYCPVFDTQSVIFTAALVNWETVSFGDFGTLINQTWRSLCKATISDSNEWLRLWESFLSGLDDEKLYALVEQIDKACRLIQHLKLYVSSCRVAWMKCESDLEEYKKMLQVKLSRHGQHRQAMANSPMHTSQKSPTTESRNFNTGGSPISAFDCSNVPDPETSTSNADSGTAQLSGVVTMALSERAILLLVGWCHLGQKEYTGVWIKTICILCLSVTAASPVDPIF